MRCDKCGAETANGALFCFSCGEPFPAGILAQRESATREEIEEPPLENSGNAGMATTGITEGKPESEKRVPEKAVLESEKEEELEVEGEADRIPAQSEEGTTENIGVIKTEGKLKPRWKRAVFIIALIFTVLACAAGGFFIYKYIKDAPRREAASYMESGDQMLDWCKTEADRIRERISLAINALLRGGIKTSDEFKSYSVTIQEKIDNLLKNVKSAICYYEEILKIEDVKDYKSYARNRINQLKLSSKSTQKTGKLMQRITEILSAAEARVRLNRNLIENEIAGFMSEIKASSKKAREYGKKAEEIKTKSNL